ncbi:hypothetical protein SASPL_126425 [Salvia splendens]|uniref:Uncharacterized protein n=1 Tax=Salvia splendens TaxID=180675 RepID=A0A8X8ZR53_SALSN|nr:hypothetical protein SASPL_126425 [Salvia splendens]
MTQQSQEELLAHHLEQQKIDVTPLSQTSQALVDFGPYQILDEDETMASELPYSYLPFRMLIFRSILADNDLFPSFLEDKEA